MSTAQTIPKKTILNRIIYCFWTGSNPMSQRRKECLSQMKKIQKTPVLCIYKSDIHKYILPDHPLHPAYEYLSETHKADYLRTYFMNFYGGGYSDIKEHYGPWCDAFNFLEARPNKYIIGYRETGPWDICVSSLENKWNQLIGNGAYICRSNTPLTNEWYNKMIALLDTKLIRLKKFPATFPQETCGTSGGKYPIAWSEMLGQIFHSTCFKYKNHLLYNLPRLNCKDYR
jgi:hypothetical protein